MTDDDRPIWATWQARYPNGPALTTDGAAADYQKAKTKILVVLKDPNNSPGTDMCSQLNSGATHPIWHTLAIWVAGILEDFPDYWELHKDLDRKNSALRQIAALNLKKVSGTNRVDDTTLHRYAFQDRHLLRHQLRNLAPQIILACGTFDHLLWLLDDDVPDTGSMMPPFVTLLSGTHLVDWRHPSRGAGKKKYDKLRDLFTHYREHPA